MQIYYDNEKKWIYCTQITQVDVKKFDIAHQQVLSF